MFANLSQTAFRAIAGTLGTVVLAGICLGGAAAPALATDAPRTVAVTTADLNLASPTGRNLLDRRIRQAAAKVCAQGGDELAVRNEVARCTRNARVAARAQAYVATAAYKG